MKDSKEENATVADASVHPVVMQLTAEQALAKLMADHIGHGMAEKCELHAFALMPLLIRIYNTGYQSGHHDTVEGGFIDIVYSEREEYHEDEVRELIIDVA